MKIGFIGAGKVGFALGKYFVDHEVAVTGYYSRSIDSAEQAAEFTGTRCYTELTRIVEDSDTLFLTVPDGAIQDVWDHIKLLPVEHKNICHVSGATTSEIFSDLAEAKAFGYSIHPLLAVSSKYESHKDLQEACFTIEGSPARRDDFLHLFSRLGNQVAVIAPEMKTLYHAASVLVSNHVVALAQLGTKLYAQCGLPEEFARQGWTKLFLGNAQKIAGQGPVQALTGPVERGDAQTVQAHLNCFADLNTQTEHGEDHVKDLYCLLSEILLDVAKEKNPQRDYEELERVLEENKK